MMTAAGAGRCSKDERMIQAHRFWPAHPLTLLLIGMACLVPLFLTPSVRVLIAPADMRPELGKAYIARLPSDALRIFVSDSDGPYGHGRSRLRLWENAIPLGPAHAPHATIREHGGGAYSHWSGNLYFSSSDGSDPRLNGRSYLATAETRLNHAVSAVLVLILLTCLWAGRRELKNRYPARLAGIAGSISLPRFSPRTATRLALAVAATIAALVIAHLAGLQYRTNDDVSARMIMEGIIGDGSQRQFLLFQNVLVGVGLHALYEAVPAFPWYDLELALTATAGAFLCQFAVLRLCTARRDFLFCFILAVVLFTPIFQAPQFTASAIVLAGGGLLLLASVWYRPPRTRLRLWTACALILASFLVGSLIRFEGAFLALVAVAPIVGLFGLRKRNAAFLLPAAGLASAIVLALLAPMLQRAYYAGSPGWENVSDEAGRRGRATEHAQLDPSRVQEFHAALAAAGWSENDYLLLSNWLFADRQLFSAERMRQFADIAPSQPLSARMAAVAQHLGQPESRFGIFAILCLAPALLRRTAAATGAGLVSIVWTGATLFLAGILFKPGLLHVTWPLYAVIALLNAGIIFYSNQSEEHDPYLRLEDNAVAAGVLLAALWLAGSQIQDGVREGADADRVRRQLAYDLAGWPAKQGDIVVVWDNNFPYQIWARPFHPIPQVPWRFFHTNLASATPLALPIYSQWGTTDIAWSVCHAPDVYLVDAGHGHAEPHARMLRTYMKEHYGESVEVARVFAGQALALYSCRRPEKAHK